jgi:hypothetical protein
MSDDTLTMEQAATELVEIDQHDNAATYDPGKLENLPAVRGDELTIEQAADLVGEDVEEFNAPAPVQDFADETTARKELHARYDQVAEAANDIAYGATALADYLHSFLTPHPDAELALSNPGEYVRLQAQHESEVKTLTRVLEHASHARKQADEINIDRHMEIIAEQNTHLVRYFPECADPEGRERFFDVMREVAYECGFGEDELRRVVDHRIFRLAHLAAVGMNRTSKPQTQPKARPRGRSTPMGQLAATGSIHDAMAVDFD